MRTLCQTLNIAPSGYYAWRRKPTSKRQDDDIVFSKQIKQIFDASKQRYGYPRVWKELQAQGVACGKHRVARLMRENNWVARPPKRFKITTQSDPNHRKVPNRLQRSFKATRMNEKWTTDITYIYTQEGWLYLAVVLDLFSRRIVGWAMDETVDKQLALDALAMAVKQRKPPENLLHHSDRGSQYTSKVYQATLAGHGMQVSMSRPGNCWDNAVTESFFSSLKTECVNRCMYKTRAAARRDVFSYIEGFYNPHRRHSTLDYLSPAEWERRNKPSLDTAPARCVH